MKYQHPAIPEKKTCHQISIANKQECFVADSQTNLLANIGKSENSPVPVGCKGGGCGKCRVKVTSGTYLSKKMSRAHITPRDEEQSIVLACRIFPQSDMNIIPL